MKNLKLKDIPVFLTIQKSKPKELNKKKYTRVTKVHCFMEWQDILTVVETIEKDKNKELHQKEQKAIQKVT